MPSRFPPFDPDNLSPDARMVYDRILKERGYVPGPYQFWLASPGIALSRLRSSCAMGSRSKNAWSRLLCW